VGARKPDNLSWVLWAAKWENLAACWDESAAAMASRMVNEDLKPFKSTAYGFGILIAFYLAIDACVVIKRRM